MANQKKNRKRTLIIVIAVLAAVAALSVLLIGQIRPDESSSQTDAPVADYALYWNVDRMEYRVNPGEEVGSTDRKPAEDGYYHVIFAKDGQQMDLRVADRRLVNRIDGVEPTLMGLVFDDDGIVIDIILLKDMPVEKRVWSFFVQGLGEGIVKFNSSAKYDGIGEIVNIGDDVLILDVSGQSEYIGAPTALRKGDRVYAICNADGDVTHIFLYERAA